MATIIEGGTPATNRSVFASDDGSSAWAVVVLVLVVAIIAGAIWYMRYYRPAATGVAPAPTVQVNLPSSGYAPAPSSNGSNAGSAGANGSINGSAGASGSATGAATAPAAQ